jgi:uncharacterized protein YndB with AHSA1/START domain
MNHDLIVSKSIHINAGATKVWKALTTPEIIKEYLYGTETLTDWQVGSEIIFQGEYQQQKYRDKGTILENIPDQRLSYSYWSGFSGTPDEPGNYSVVTYELNAIDANHTLLTWTQKGFANEELFKHSESGMDAFLREFKNVVERISDK